MGKAFFLGWELTGIRAAYLTIASKHITIVKNYLEMEAVVLGSAIRGWDDWFSYRVEGKIATDFSFLCVKKSL